MPRVASRELDQVYRDMVGSGYGVRPENIEVSLHPRRRGAWASISTSHCARACRRGARFHFMGDRVSGDNFDLAMSIHVPHEQITQRRPAIQIDDPMIERRVE
jgi:hypothetical protein